MWHHYVSARLKIHMTDNERQYVSHRLASRLEGGARPQLFVLGGTWFAARPEDPRRYSLVGCAVAPGFEFQDFELAERKKSLRRFPAHRSAIETFTRA